MTDITAGSMLDAIGQVLDGDFSVEDRTLLSAEVVHDGKQVFSTIALNDVVVNKGAVGRLIEFLVHIDDEFVYDLRADGLIVATPTGMRNVNSCLSGSSEGTVMP